MPENIRYGVTITPPNGDPVTGTAIPEWDASRDFALVGMFGVQSNMMYPSNNPNNYTVSAQASGPYVNLPNGYYYFRIIFGKLDSSITAINVSGGGVTKTFDVSTLTAEYNRNVCIGNPSQYGTFEFGSNANGVVGFSVTGNANAYYNITIMIVAGGAANTLSAANIVEGKIINGITGTMVIEDATNFIGYCQNGATNQDVKCVATKNNFNWGMANSSAAIILTQGSNFTYIKGAMIGLASGTGSFNYTGGSWNGKYGPINISNINANNISSFTTKNYNDRGNGFILKVGTPVIPSL